jgi:V/A-type H+-transporting ATPase subunit K
MNESRKFGAALLALTLFVGVAATVLLVAAMPGEARAAGAGSGTALAGEVWTWGLAAAAASTALAALGAGFAVAKVGTAAIGALAEKPELFGRLLIFVGLAEGIAIYGLIVSILILNRLT